jgi:hypothetical protein
VQVISGRARQLSHRSRGQRLQSDPVHPRQFAQDNPQRVVALELVVAIRPDHERLECADTPSEHPQRVKRRLVGPVQILQHDQMRAAQRRAERCQQVRRRRTGLRQVRHRPAKSGRDVEQWSERPRREQRLTRALEHRHRPLLRLQLANERRLTHPGLTAHEHQPAAPLPTHLVCALLEQVERCQPLK